MKDTTLQAVRSCHELIKWLIPYLDKFSSVRRFMLGIGIIMRRGVDRLAEGSAPIYLPRTTTIRE